MSNLVATINGVKVFSDKKMTTISNTRISFSDGSYADVATKEVVNKGPGYINLGSSFSGANEQKFREEKVTASNLVIADLAANVHIEPYDQKDITLQIEGPESLVNDINISNSETTAIVRGKSSNQGGVTIIGSGVQIGGISVASVNIGNNISIVGGNINVGGPELSILVKLPRQTNVELSDVNGEVSLGNTEGNLDVSIGGTCKVVAGRIKKLTGRISGSGKIHADYVQGNVKCRIGGSGKVDISGGNIDELEVSISGSGKAEINATAQNADLDVSGSGQIYVQHVVNKPRQHMSGVGRIKVGNW